MFYEIHDEAQGQRIFEVLERGIAEQVGGSEAGSTHKEEMW